MTKTKTTDTPTDEALATATEAIDAAEANSRAAKGQAPEDAQDPEGAHTVRRSLRELENELRLADENRELRAKLDALTDQRVRPEFAPHRLNQSGAAAAEEVRRAFSYVLEKLDANVPPGRAKALVVTKLQEAAHWANRGIAEFPSNQVSE